MCNIVAVNDNVGEATDYSAAAYRQKIVFLSREDDTLLLNPVRQHDEGVKFARQELVLSTKVAF